MKTLTAAVTVHRRIFVLCLAFVMLIPLFLLTAQESSARSFKRSGEVYLFRGTGGVFSGGLDTLAKKIKRRGMKAEVYGHRSWRRVLRNILKRHKKRKVRHPIILVGHSAGGRAALSLARELGKEGLRVSYVATLDPNTRSSVGPRVRRVVNYYIPNAKNSNVLLRGRGFRGSLQNVNVSSYPKLNHLNIEENERLHRRIIRAAFSY